MLYRNTEDFLKSIIGINNLARNVGMGIRPRDIKIPLTYRLASTNAGHGQDAMNRSPDDQFGIPKKNNEWGKKTPPPRCRFAGDF